jgi:hypothetical protein
MFTSRLNIRCCSSFKPEHHSLKHTDFVLKRINQYNDNILILRNKVKHTIQTDSIYDTVCFDQRDEMCVTIADCKHKVDNELSIIQDRQCLHYLE